MSLRHTALYVPQGAAPPATVFSNYFYDRMMHDMITLRQSTASQDVIIGAFIDDTDFKTPETALTIANTDIKLMKDGAASVNKNSGGGTHRINGEYSITLDATDTNTVGELRLSVAVSGALPVWKTFQVVEEAVYDLWFAASASGNVTLAAAIHTGAVIPTVSTLTGHTAQTADHTAGIADIPTVAEFNARTLLAADYFDPAVDAVANVTTVATTTTNTDMRGTNLAALATALTTVDNEVGAIQTDVTTLLARIIGTLATGTHNPATAAQIAVLSDWINGGRLDLLLDAIPTTAMRGTDSAATAAALATVDTVVDAIKVKTDSLTFTVAGQADSNIQSINDVTLTGDGSANPFDV